MLYVHIWNWNDPNVWNRSFFLNISILSLNNKHNIDLLISQSLQKSLVSTFFLSFFLFTSFGQYQIAILIYHFLLINRKLCVIALISNFCYLLIHYQYHNNRKCLLKLQRFNLISTFIRFYVFHSFFIHNLIYPVPIGKDWSRNKTIV